MYTIPTIATSCGTPSDEPTKYFNFKSLDEFFDFNYGSLNDFGLLSTKDYIYNPTDPDSSLGWNSSEYQKNVLGDILQDKENTANFLGVTILCNFYFDLCVVFNTSTQQEPVDDWMFINDRVQTINSFNECFTKFECYFTGLEIYSYDYLDDLKTVSLFAPQKMQQERTIDGHTYTNDFSDLFVDQLTQNPFVEK